jgi:formimidoylglutamate deiminase
MAGLAERGGGAGDSFWSWREVMYGFVAQLTPDDLSAIAAQLYVEMLKAGYTAVGEFHYLHRDPAGRAYADGTEMSERIVAAAGRAGIGLTLLPVLYLAGGFDGVPPSAAQRRFVTGVEELLRLVEQLRARHGADPDFRVGIAPHSLRAVPPAALAACLDGLAALDGDAPIHIHVAEQEAEVEACRRARRARPVEWLLAHAPVDRRWCLVHATHMTAEETRALAQSGAVAGLCPSTEANLGDGLFPLAGYLETGGRFGIGSDSQVSVSPVEELRWLEYGQRLSQRRRAVAAGGATASSGAILYRGALAGGAQALGRPLGALAPGKRADIVVLDAAHPALAGRDGDALLDSYLFAGNLSPLRDVMVGGRWVIRDGHHADEEAIAQAYRETAARLARGAPEAARREP